MIIKLPVTGMFTTNSYFLIDSETNHGFLIDPAAEAYKLLNYIKENNFTLVITTHLFPALTLTAINKTEKPSINFITIATDYEPCPFMEESKPNMLIIQKDLEEKLRSFGGM